ncbi:MAG: PEP-CTERM sorting domain-containing protein [Deltaproteobacteria bacterium]|nr:PEP-CTERM sorting domain-containing protein [Deltaproteobacteria bacterium]
MRKLAGFALALLVSSAAATAWAGAVLHIGNPPNAGTYLFGGEVLPLDSRHASILENGNGQPSLLDPLLLILGVPDQDDSTFTAPAVTLSTGFGIVGGTNVFSGAWNATTGYAGAFDAADGGDVYSFIGLVPGGNNSNNFGNWAAADLAVNGISANYFGIFVYTLSNTGISGGVQVDVTFDADLAKGIFAIGYGQNARGDAFSTPFTESGLTIPEPGTSLLLASGLLGLAGWARRKALK